jgi:hypothetical protein
MVFPKVLQIKYKDNLQDKRNSQLGFKSLHYQVIGSNGTVEVTVVKKKKDEEVAFGIRTSDISATSPKNYIHEDKIVSMRADEKEYKFEVPIIDDKEWEPDQDFAIELYDPNIEEGYRLTGDDTRCVVTILDENFPGILGFELSEVKIQRGENEVEIVVTRTDGSDGTISCIIKTDCIIENGTSVSALEFDDYCPFL